jgi:2-polyprenyl-3-methyl-5-hydroxy-6-metoxy-1,4-benzoquinol methylase
VTSTNDFDWGEEMGSASETPTLRSAERPEPAAATAGSPCLVCAGSYTSSRLPGLVQCTTCGFVSADLAITDEELSALYGTDFFHGAAYRDHIAEETSLRLNFQRRLAVLRRLVPGWSEADLVEVGCAYGFFLAEVRDEVCSVRGIDISREAVTYAVQERGLNAVHGDYLTHDTGDKVDVIAIWDTIEHLRRPDLVLHKAAEDLKPGGAVALTTGDIGSLNARLRGGSWRMIHPPIHLHYFSVATLSRLLDRCGFDVVHVSHPGNTRNLRSVLHFILALRMGRETLYQALQSWPIWDLRVTANLFDIMYIVGRRRPAP